MSELKEDILSWLNENNSQWVFDEIAKIKERYEHKARQLNDEQKEELTRRLQLMSWGKLNFEPYGSIESIYVCPDIIKDVEKIKSSAKGELIQASLKIIVEKAKNINDPKSVRAYIIDKLNASIYYKVKKKEISVIGIFQTKEND